QHGDKLAARNGQVDLVQRHDLGFAMAVDFADFIEPDQRLAAHGAPWVAMSVMAASPAATSPDSTAVDLPSVLPSTKSRGSGWPFLRIHTRPCSRPLTAAGKGGMGDFSAVAAGVKRSAPLGTSSASCSRSVRISAVAVMPGRSNLRSL